MTTAPIEIRIDSAGIEEALRKAPSVAYFWLRRFLVGAFIKHRTSWLRAKGVKFGRAGESSRAIRVSRVGEGPANPQPNDVVYRAPKAERVAPTAAPAALEAMQAEVFTGSIPLRVHEFGEDIRTSGWMAIAVRTRPRQMGRWIAQNPNASLKYVKSDRDPNVILVYERLFKRPRGRPRGEASSYPLAPKPRGRLRFVLRKFVEMDPTLRFYANWDSTGSERTSLMRYTADKILSDLAKGDALAKDVAHAPASA